MSNCRRSQADKTGTGTAVGFLKPPLSSNRAVICGKRLSGIKMVSRCPDYWINNLVGTAVPLQRAGFLQSAGTLGSADKGRQPVRSTALRRSQILPQNLETAAWKPRPGHDRDAILGNIFAHPPQ